MGELRKKRILVVEDDPVGQFVVVDALTAHGYDVSLARTGPEGIAMAHATQPDLILCDVLLPQKSGFEVCFEVKRSARTRDVPVVFMSAVCRDSYAEAYAAIDLRAEAYFVKPFRMGALVSRIRGLLTT